MLSFFPNPYPDELLYSVLARYHVRSGNTSPKVTLREVFNTITCTATVDLPSNLNSLVENMPLGSQYKVECFIEENTLYHLYAPFLPSTRAKKVFNSMKSNHGGDIHTTTGIMASTIHMPQYLRFCPECFKEDVKKFGEAYWHRVHQIASCIVCSKHKTLIKDSTVMAKAFNKHEFHSASENNCVINVDRSSLKSNNMEMYLRISKDIEWILGNKIKSKGLEWFYDKYKTLLIEKGLSTVNGRINQDQLIYDFINFYGQEFLKKLQCSITETSSNWLSNIVRKPKNASHPIRHILIMNFLLGTVEGFFTREINYRPFGSGPWPCLNKASNHYHKNVIKTVSITYDGKSKKAIGTFSCLCGFIYSRGGPDKDEGDRYRYGRVKEFGSSWKSKLLELLANKDLSLREISRQLNVDVRTIKRYGEKCDLLREENNIANIAGKSSENILGKNYIVRGTYRSRWISLNKSYAGLSRTELMKKDEAAHTWLYRHDKSWLNNNSPSPRKVKYINNRVDWDNRDNEILEKVKNLIDTKANLDDKPERITINGISKKLGLAVLKGRYIDKLPKTKEYLKNIVESVEDYEIKRIMWAARCLNMENEELKKWKVIRKAALRSVKSKRIEEAIEDQLKIYSKLWNRKH